VGGEIKGEGEGEGRVRVLVNVFPGSPERGLDLPDMGESVRTFGSCVG
jgi:hypothetical protein